MLLTEKLKQDLFSPSERGVIDYLFAEREHIHDQTMKQIAEATYTHPSILSRIATKLDFSGWLDLKIQFLEEIEYLNRHFSNIDANYPFADGDSLMIVANKMATLKQMTIEDTLSLLDHEAFEQAVTMLHEARHIKVFSIIHNLLLCHDFKSKMNRIGKQVTLCEVDAEFEAANSDETTCALLISYTGESDYTVGLIPYLKSRRVPVLALTSLGENAISHEADCTLRLTTRERLYSKIGSFTSNDSIHCLLDFLYAGVFAKDYEEHLKYKIQISKRLDHRKSSSEIMQEKEHPFT
ncbi:MULTISPECIES: MurR/RpiR family transcriptional regulator [unclassified Exiguobacterium]|uniref:MurR/RpiR family transcriptional regulator n=1 Tax=unclassified Exiguobacterium TaxID=2644629 RepID=UPI00103CAE79|nr:MULTISPECIES: MurR/RpiR family transcriptional regulator [unclassified Exiguobacterium]TCI48564.1 MurR/RpiR family transcriptional regulator [Exiguobacterium sp. SH5S32]TCI55450.1 MurR/RpiR family transcriptional regulator [Exiguobacterium sp. SH1S4]TCI75245.1 MurR/RpiR family transcriptional regulator [Exiguobacterium sp. SH1S1]